MVHKKAQLQETVQQVTLEQTLLGCQEVIIHDSLLKFFTYSVIQSLIGSSSGSSQESGNGSLAGDTGTNPDAFSRGNNGPLFNVSP